MEIWKCTFKKTEESDGLTIVSCPYKIYRDGIIWAVGKAVVHASECGMKIVSIVSVQEEECDNNDC